MVRIRLRRMGAPKQPSYRVVAAERIKKHLEMDDFWKSWDITIPEHSQLRSS